MSLVSKPFRSLDVRGLHLRQDFQRSGQACVSHDDGAHVRLPEFSVPAKRREREPVLCLHQGPTGSVPGAVEGGDRQPQWLEWNARRMDTCAGGPEGTVLRTGRCERVLSALCTRHFEAVCDDFYTDWYHSKAALFVLYISCTEEIQSYPNTTKGIKVQQSHHSVKGTGEQQIYSFRFERGEGKRLKAASRCSDLTWITSWLPLKDLRALLSLYSSCILWFIK